MHFTRTRQFLDDLKNHPIAATITRVTPPQGDKHDAPDFRMLFDAAPSPNLILRADAPHFTIVAANNAYLAATMTTREHIVGRPIFDAFPDNPDDPEATGVRRVRESIEHVIAHRQPHTMAVQRYDVARPDGNGFEEKYWSPVHVPVLGPGGEVAYIIQRPEDVTEFVRLTARAGEQDRRAEELRGRAERMEAEVFLRAQELAEVNADLRRQVEERKQAESALAREQNFLRAVLDSAADGIVACDGDGVLRFFNGAARAFHGVDEQPLPPERWAEQYDLYLPDGRTRMAKEQVPLFRALVEGTVKDAEMVIAVNGRPPRLLTANGRAITDADGRTLGAVVVMHDLTDRKLGEELREHAVREEAGRKGAEASAQRLRDSEERFRQLADAMPQMVWVARPDGFHEYYNQRWYEFTGVSYGTTDGEGWNGLFHPDDQERAWAAWRHSLATGEPYEVEYRLRHQSGEYRWTLGRALPVRNAGGQITKWFGTCTDIDSLKRLQEEREHLLESERESRREAELLAGVGQIVSGELDLQMLVQKVVDATTGLTRAQFGAFFYNVLNDKGESYSLYALSGVPREAFASFPMPRMTHVFGPTFRGEGVVRSDDVTRDERYGKNAPYHGMPKGHLPVRSYLAVSVISRSGEVLGGLFFGHAEPGVFTDRDERLVLGIAAQTAVAMDNARLFEAAKKANEAKDALLASEQAARGEAERASRMKDEFLATLSHELRTLNAILGWSQIIKRSSKPVDVAQGLDVIERNARSQAQIIEDLLDMSRIISGKVRLDVHRLDLAAIVQTAIETARPTADAKGIGLKSVIDPLVGIAVSGDANRLQQVLWNLLTNAIKFTPKGGHVQVLLERVNSHLEISVIDTGEGIRPDFLPYVFDRFRQADGSITRRHGGLGLGLSIVKQLVELHGGSIRVKSMGEGFGSTFIVSLPLTVLQPDPHADGERRHPKAGGNAPSVQPDLCSEIAGVRVLVVDDEPDARALVKRLLEDCHAIVSAAASAAEAFEKLRAERPDVLISDVGMPTSDGYQFMRQVRTLPEGEGGKTPALALTAYARAEDRVQAIRSGFQMHVPKPVEPAELITMVASLAGRDGR